MTTAGARTVKSFCRICGYVEADHDLPAPWVDQYVERLGGWRLAPAVLVDQLAQIIPPAPLVFTPRRQVRKLNSSIRRGAVSVPHGHEGANVNRLTDEDDIDRTTGMAHYSGIPVTVRPASEA